MVVGATGEDSSQATITNGSKASADNSASSAGAAYVFQASHCGLTSMTLQNKTDTACLPAAAGRSTHLCVVRLPALCIDQEKT